MISVYYTYIDWDIHRHLMENELPKMPLPYQRKVLSFKRWQDAQLSLAGRILLRKNLKNIKSKLTIRDISYTNHNKPFFKESTESFSISHSGNIVVCAITHRGMVGIDLEKKEIIDFSLFKPQMKSSEWHHLIKSEKPYEDFFEYWTQKEAVIKAHGMGLSIPLKSFEIIKSETVLDSKEFTLHELKLDSDYVCHLATDIKDCKIRVQEISRIA